MGLSIIEELLIQVDNNFPEFFNEIDWSSFSSYKGLSEEFIDRYSHLLNWKILSSQQLFNLSFIQKHKDKLDLRIMQISHSNLCASNPEFFSKNFKKIEKKKFKVRNNTRLFNNEQCFEFVVNTIRDEYPNEFECLDWKTISSMRFLSDEFIDQYSDKLNWGILCTIQKLSQETIEKHSDKVNWKSVSITQISRLDVSFIFKYINRLDLNIIKNKLARVPG